MKHLLLYGIALMQVCLAQAATYYLDSEKGNDLADGRSETTAWKTLKQDPRVTTSMDLYYMGLLFVDPHYLKRHYRIRI